MNALADFLSHEAGQRRRNWLDSQSARAGNALSYYLGPTGIDQKLNALAQALWLSDAGDVAEAADASQALWNDPSMANAGRYATAAAAMMVPAVSARMANAGGDVLGDALASGADDVRRFIGDEYGGIRAYHGSPHDFDEFSLDKIGTGEGAQAYGHGLYFAESEDVARAYRDALRFPRVDNINSPAQEVMDDLNYHRGNVEGVKAAYTAMLESGNPDAIARAQAKMAVIDDVVSQSKGSMYEVNINANPDDFLDWDKPLSEQSQKVREAIGPAYEGINPDLPIGRTLDAIGMRRRWAGEPGTDMQIASKTAKDAGIPGIKYLDQGSRGAGEGSRNYVVFDDKLISIVRKYGVAGAAAALGVSAQEVEAAMNDGRANEIEQYLAELKP